jgi:hypothetical protein
MHLDKNPTNAGIITTDAGEYHLLQWNVDSAIGAVLMAAEHFGERLISNARNP